jgi:isoamylase
MPEQIAQRSPAGHAKQAAPPGEVREGRPTPLGAHRFSDGVNFTLFSRHATRVRLEFYDAPEDGTPSRSIDLEAPRHRTGDIWHVWVQGVPAGQLYAYRVDGPYRPREGHRFNPHKLLLDPCATAIARPGKWDFGPARGYDPSGDPPDLFPSTTDDAATMPKSIFLHEHFDWEGDSPPRHSPSEIVIYETHVRGCTMDPSSGVSRPGTYHGLTERIPYFKDLGITTLELMPVQEFNEDDRLRVNPLTGEKLTNYWGYDPVAFFAPKASYSSHSAKGQQKLEFKEMVKAFHRADIAVILDVVMNHTAEGSELGPTICLRGIDNSIFYLLDEHNPRFYKDYTGVGNTLNANHPVVCDFIMDVLRYWAMEMHVDGFRFDLASVLGRDEHGRLLSNPPLLERIAEDPILRDIKIIAEAWDEGGAYQVGSFSERRWAEWNGRFRDDVRRFWLGEPGMIGRFATRLCGSSDLYERSGKGPVASINFITSHDGFTLNDLVSYKQKHNEENGEYNRDGTDTNDSDNYGVEGPSTDPSIESIRNRQIKNFLATLFLSRGIPMLLGGDEFRRTQRGNNNAYCQDNEMSWYDWRLLETHREIHRFTRGMISFRRAHPVLRRPAFYTDSDIQWFNTQGTPPSWQDPQQQSLACLIFGQGEPDLYLMFNASKHEESFRLPQAPNGNAWRLAVDTYRAAPGDYLEAGEESPLQSQDRYRVGPRSSVVLLARS